MRDSLLIKIVLLVTFFVLNIFPADLHAAEIYSPINDVKTHEDEIVDISKQMSQKQMNDLFGEDPYLGQTSYLQSPEGFRQREKKK